MSFAYDPKLEALAERASNRTDFGVTLHPERTSTKFVIWAPAASKVEVALYDTCSTQHRATYAMHRALDGCFVLEILLDLTGKYYTYLISDASDEKRYEITDPWAKASGPNSRRGLILDPRSLDPEGFRALPALPPVDFGRTVIYELSVRDFTSHPTSGVAHRGL